MKSEVCPWTIPINIKESWRQQHKSSRMEISIRSLGKDKGHLMLWKTNVEMKTSICTICASKDMLCRSKHLCFINVISDYMKRSTASQAREFLQPSTLLHRLFFLSLQVRTLIPSWILLSPQLLVFLLSMTLHKRADSICCSHISPLNF